MQKSTELADLESLALKFPRAAAAFRGELSADDLSGEEREAYYARLDALIEQPGPTEEAFYAEMRERGGVVGEDENGRLIRLLAGGGMVVIEEYESADPSTLPGMTESDYQLALHEIEGLMGAKRGTPEGDRLDALVRQVEDYEDIHVLSFPVDSLVKAFSQSSS